MTIPPATTADLERDAEFDLGIAPCPIALHTELWHSWIRRAVAAEDRVKELEHACGMLTDTLQDFWMWQKKAGEEMTVPPLTQGICKGGTNHTKEGGPRPPVPGGSGGSRDKEIADLRDVIRLMIGQDDDIPWRDVPQFEVDAYIKEICRLKGGV